MQNVIAVFVIILLKIKILTSNFKKGKYCALSED